MDREAHERLSREFGDWLIATNQKAKMAWAPDGEVRGNCPKSSHPDTHPSFAYDPVKDCWVCTCGGGKGSELRTELGYAKKAISQNGKKIVATYDYRDKNGNLLFQTVRYEPKEFQQRRPDPNSRDGWKYSVKGIPLVPYRLEKFLTEPDPIVIVEGEKDANNGAEKLLLSTTCNPMGVVGGWKEEYSKWFKGRKVIVVADKDDEHNKFVGQKHAKKVAGSLFRVAAEVRIVEMPGDAVKDLSDWIFSGGTREAFDQVAAGAQPMKEEKPDLQTVAEPERPRSARDKYFEKGTFYPERLAQDILAKHRMIATPDGTDGLGTWIHLYRNGVFARGAEAVVVDECRAALWDEVNAHRATNVKDNIRMAVRTSYDNLNPRSRDLINVRNGMLEWRTGKLLPHDPSYLSTMQINADWIPDTKSDQLDTFFSSLLPDDEIQLLLEFIGYLLMPDTSFGKCLVLVGEGGNGKSTVLELIRHLLGGEANVASYSLHSLTEDRFTVANIFGKLANFFDDLDTKAVENTGVFKSIVTGNPIKGEEKGKPPFHFKPFARLVFATNFMPRANDRSQGFFDRLMFMRFERRVRASQAEIFKYHEVLAATPGLMPAMLARAVEGLRRLHDQRGFTKSKSCADSLEEYRRECNSAYDFLQENCTFEDPTAWTPKSDIYDNYKAWAKEAGRKFMSEREFNKTVVGLNVVSVRHGAARGWRGIKFAYDSDIAQKSREVQNFGVQSSDSDGNLRF